MTEETKMLAGKLYDPTDSQLETRRLDAHEWCQKFNQTTERDPQRFELQAKLFPDAQDGVFIQGPLFADYGCYTHFGKDVYANANLTVLDTCPIHVGDNCMLGPNVSLVTPMHPLLPAERRLRQRPDGSKYDLEYGKPITIGKDCWLASNVTVTGGVTIGDGCVIGAGSVVTRDIPASSLAVGNPCRVVRQITAADAIALKKQLY